LVAILGCDVIDLLAVFPTQQCLPHFINGHFLHISWQNILCVGLFLCSGYTFLPLRNLPFCCILYFLKSAARIYTFEGTFAYLESPSISVTEAISWAWLSTSPVPVIRDGAPRITFNIFHLVYDWAIWCWGDLVNRYRL
jgi:hypothetical protein